MALPGKAPKSIAPWIWTLACLIPAHTLASNAREKSPCHTTWAELQSEVKPSPTSIEAPRTHFRSVQGTLVNPPPAILNVARGDRVYRLGAGIMGGTVYRVVPEQGAPFVLKVYNHIDSAIGDIAAFEHWQSLDLDEYIRIARHELRPNSQVMRLESIEGMTVEAFLQNPHIDPATQQIVRTRYRELLYNFVERVAYTGMNITHRQVDQEAAHFALDIRFGQSIGITLKPDNVIVDAETLELVLVDPF